jgi:hypothetical protein
MAWRVTQSHGGTLRYGPAQSSPTGARFELWLPCIAAETTP